jgi:hypothetical protein
MVESNAQYVRSAFLMAVGIDTNRCGEKLADRMQKIHRANHHDPGNRSWTGWSVRFLWCSARHNDADSIAWSDLNSLS